MNYEATEVVQGGELAGVNTETPFYDAGIDGTGQVVGSGDSGLDDRHCAFSAPGKVAMKRSTTGDYADFSGHGTHVVGSIVGSLTDDGSGSKYDGVAKGASVAFTDMGYQAKATRICYCLDASRPLTRPCTCTPDDAYGNFRFPHILGAFPNGEARTLVGLPGLNFHACRDGSGNMMCTALRSNLRRRGDDGMEPRRRFVELSAARSIPTEYLNHVPMIAHTTARRTRIISCAKIQLMGVAYTLRPMKKCSDYVDLTEYYPDGFEKEALETPDDMGPEMYDYAKAAGAYIHSDSWGGNTPAYDVQVNQVDTYAWNNLNFLPMFAAGNEGEDAEAASPEDSVRNPVHVHRRQGHSRQSNQREELHLRRRRAVRQLGSNR